jgi:hypothetical protein
LHFITILRQIAPALRTMKMEDEILRQTKPLVLDSISFLLS